MHTQTQMVPVAAPMVPMAPSPLRKVSGGPFCCVCNLHIGMGAVIKVCGACARRRKGQKATLSLAELTRFARLARKHWTGTARELLTAPGGYRPTLYTGAPAPSAPAPAASNHCGPACAQCSRASEACDEEVRRTNKWDGAQCKRKKQVCDPLVALQNATSCSCD